MSRPGFTPSNVMDSWILSFTQSLNMFVKEEMKSMLTHLNDVLFFPSLSQCIVCTQLFLSF